MTTTSSPTTSGVDIGDELAPGVIMLQGVIVNLFFLGRRGGPWVLVDAGMPGSGARIKAAAAKHFGPESKPAAIILTHGHFDHVGALGSLVQAWDVPIYVHPLEVPYLSGQSSYPPQDPTTGGFFSQLSRVFPHHGYDFGARVQMLPSDGSVPHAPDWRWVHAPGHTAGQIALFRDADRVLLVADAFTTINQDSALEYALQRRGFFHAPSYLTTDWNAATDSVARLAALNPALVAAGHGRPMNGPSVAEELRAFAAQRWVPPHGRYVGHPATTDEHGVVTVPPPVPDPFPKQAAIAGLVALGALLATRSRQVH